jgi:hypothetical protein
MDITQPAHLAVDQIFAFARAIQTTRDLDISREGVHDFVERGMSVGVAAGRRVTVSVMTIAVMPVAVAVTICLARGRGVAGVELRQRRNVDAGNRCVGRERLRRQWQAGEAKAHLRRSAGLACVAAIEDDVFHLVAAEALGALFAKHPRDGVGDVALAASIGTDDGGDTLVEGKLRAIGERLESGYFEAFEAHSRPLIPES